MIMDLQFFGGIGSHSGRGGGRSKVSLAKLIGSPKQIKWAQDIRQRLQDALKELREGKFKHPNGNIYDENVVKHFGKVVSGKVEHGAMGERAGCHMPTYYSFGSPKSWKEFLGQKSEAIDSAGITDADKHRIAKHFDTLDKNYTGKVNKAFQNHKDKSGRYIDPKYKKKLYNDFLQDIGNKALKDNNEASWWIDNR